MLSLKHLAISSFNENVVYLHRDCETYKVDEVGTVTKVEVHGGAAPVFAFLEIVDDDSLVSPDELGANNETFARLNLPEGANVSLNIAPLPASVAFIRRKMMGNILSEGEYKSIVNDISNHRYSNMDIASFLIASGSFMSAPETLALTGALVGEKVFHWDNENMVVDHHCLGGVPGNKTDIIITAIVAAYGLPILKTAARSITSCAGVADVFAVLANVNLDENKIGRILTESRGVIADYNRLPLVGACKLMSSIERLIGISQQQHIISEILAIKLAAGVTHLVLDIPVGETSRIKSTAEAVQVRKLAEYVGDMLGLEVDAVITDGSEPIGNGVGAMLEARDVMKVLRNRDDAPKDLLEKSLFLAGRILEFDPKLRGGQGYHVAKEILNSGRALEALNHIIYAQGKAEPSRLGQLTREIISRASGVVRAIDNQRINHIGIMAGASQYSGAGLDLLKKVGDSVDVGEPLYVIHSTNSGDFALANSMVEADNGYTIN
ncbi:MAG: thymidine phosphorylase [Alphaproteobacteria bacterium]|nr:thymidine phosphorylase [Alphaproteobacteria bacterium]